MNERAITMEFSRPFVVGVVTFLVIIVSLLIIIVLKTWKKKAKRVLSHEKVILHQMPPTGRVPNISPPCLKLETCLRMAKIPYESEYGFKMSSKGKVPWIEYDNETMADSAFIIRYLNKKFETDIDSHLSDLSPFEEGVAHATIKMIEENTYWTLIYYCFMDGTETLMNMSPLLSHLKFPVREIVYFFVKNLLGLYMYGHGIGRHTKEEIYQIARQDLQAVSRILGNKKFMFGTKSSLLDAVVFGLVSNFFWNVPESPQAQFIRADLKNLESHCILMKETFYPDWDELSSRKV